MGHHKEKKKKKGHSTREGRKRAFTYKPLEVKEKIPMSDYQADAYEFFKSVKWDRAWIEFNKLRKDGTYDYHTAWEFAKSLVGNKANLNKEQKEQAEWIFAAIGPADNKKKGIVPYLGDWAYQRASMSLGEVDKESVLYGNPKIAAIREMLKKHTDVMEISQGIGELLMGWIGRFDNWATQVDEYFKYRLFDPKISFEKNEIRFAKYTKMQEYLFTRQIDATRQVLRSFGVGENDLSLLTQIMIASYRDKLGPLATNMMLAANSGVKVIDGGQANMLPEGSQVGGSPYTGMIETNPALKEMLGTFIVKSKAFAMEHPDVEIEGVPEEDKSTNPLEKIQQAQKTNGKAHKNGKAMTQ